MNIGFLASHEMCTETYDDLIERKSTMCVTLQIIIV